MATPLERLKGAYKSIGKGGLVASTIGLGVIGAAFASNVFLSEGESQKSRTFMMSARERRAIEKRIASQYPDPAQADPWLVQRGYENRNNHHRYGPGKKRRD